MEDAAADRLLASLPDAERDESWRLVLRDGRVVGYGSGLVELARAMRVTRPVSRALARFPEGALDRLYSVLSNRRDLLARVVPDGPAPRRFP
jgi:hypothetical protein